MIRRIEAFVQKLQLCAQVFDVGVEVLERIVSEVKEVRSVALTSSEKPVILYGDAEKKAGFVHEVLEPRVGLQGLSPHGRCVPIAVPIRKKLQVQVATWRASTLYTQEKSCNNLRFLALAGNQVCIFFASVHTNLSHNAFLW
jgi:hypothetical protein